MKKAVTNMHQKSLFDIDYNNQNNNIDKESYETSADSSMSFDDDNYEKIKAMLSEEIRKIVVPFQERYEKELDRLNNILDEKIKKGRSDSETLSDRELNITSEDDRPYKVGFSFYDEIPSSSQNKTNLFLQIDDNEFNVRDLSIDTILGEYLKQRGISQTWLAEQTGINRVTLINIIKNPNTVTYVNAKKISLVLGESASKLFPVND